MLDYIPKFGLAWEREIPIGNRCYITGIMPLTDGPASLQYVHHIISCETGYQFRVMMKHDKIVFMLDDASMYVQRGDYKELRRTYKQLCRLAKSRTVSREIY